METRLVFQGVVFTLHPTALTVEGQHSAAVNNIAIRDGEMQLHLVNFTGKLTLQLEAGAWDIDAAEAACRLTWYRQLLLDFTP